MQSMLSSITARERFILLVSPLIFFSYLSYTYLVPYTYNTYNQLLLKEQHLSEQNMELNKFANNFSIEDYNKKIASYILQIKQKEESLAQIEYNIMEIKQEYKKINSNINWVKIISLISTSAIQYKVIINNINNISSSKKESMKLAINGEGRYKNILKFINALESYNIKLLVNNIVLKKASNVKFKLEVSEVNYSL